MVEALTTFGLLIGLAVLYGIVSFITYRNKKNQAREFRHYLSVTSAIYNPLDWK